MNLDVPVYEETTVAFEAMAAQHVVAGNWQKIEATHSGLESQREEDRTGALLFPQSYMLSAQQALTL